MKNCLLEILGVLPKQQSFEYYSISSKSISHEYTCNKKEYQYSYKIFFEEMTSIT